MEPKEFCYWLRGFFELLNAGPKTAEKLTLTAEQVEMIDKHLASVFAEKIMWQPMDGTGVGCPTQPPIVTCTSTPPATGFIC